MYFSTLLTCAGLVHLGIAGYTLEDDYSVGNFFSMFNFITGPDSSTQGYTNYLSQSAAQSAGLINTNNNQVYMGVDYSNVAQSPGRSSLRLESVKTYTHGLIVLNLAHMPGGICGTWPAFWTYGPNWPNSGEIDIIEGVNNNAQNSMTLHTKSGCSVNNQNSYNPVTGSTTLTSNCDVNAAGQSANAGCGNLADSSTTYGSQFNSQGGGTYATEWTSSAIKIWFWPAGTAPGDVSGSNPNPSGWGTPTSIFQGGCNIDSFFQNNKIVFDNTFCGAWAGAVWGSSSCASQASSCQAFVQNNPSAFQQAYWTVNSLRVYQENSNSAADPAPDGVPAASSISVDVPVASSSSVPESSVAESSSTTSVAFTSTAALSAAASSVNTAPVQQTTTFVRQPKSADPSSPASTVTESSSDLLSSNEFGPGSNGIPNANNNDGHQKREQHGHQHRRHMDMHLGRAKGHHH
ncbi:hypothetical protein MMC14_007037 [Varicellaria rhodocarpa]|nr:hypothetical protein [Varicellaria rhodocarpa]